MVLALLHSGAPEALGLRHGWKEFIGKLEKKPGLRPAKTEKRLSSRSLGHRMQRKDLDAKWFAQRGRGRLGWQEATGNASHSLVIKVAKDTHPLPEGPRCLSQVDLPSRPPKLPPWQQWVVSFSLFAPCSSPFNVLQALFLCIHHNSATCLAQEAQLLA